MPQIPSTPSREERYFFIISILCPATYTFVTNCFKTTARLFVIGGAETGSNEEINQGDPVAIAIYAPGITSLLMMMIKLVTTKCDDIKMVAFADGFSAAGKLRFFFQWWTALLEIGPKFGYSLSSQNHGSSKAWNTCTWKRTFKKYQSKDNKFW